MLNLFQKKPMERLPRPRIEEPDWPGMVYAIGDVHGCLAQLRALEARIAQDCLGHGQPALVVMLGDYVDRGPSSAGVLDHLVAPAPSQFRRICLAGNHEDMMLEFLHDPQPGHPWLHFGGEETLLSYGLDPHGLFYGGRRQARYRLASHIPDEHIAFLRQLAVCAVFPRHVFAHAGLRPDTPLADQADQTMLWIRNPPGAFAAPQPFGTVIHGHTPAAAPLVEPGRICVDTGAYATGVLSAVRLDAQGAATFLNTAPP